MDNNNNKVYVSWLSSILKPVVCFVKIKNLKEHIKQLSFKDLPDEEHTEDHPFF